jgi:hypothetical protein
MSSETLHSSLRTHGGDSTLLLEQNTLNHNHAQLQVKSSIQPFSFSSFNLLRTISTESNNELAVNLSLPPTLSTNTNDLNALNQVKLTPQKPTSDSSLLVQDQRQQPKNDSLKIGDYILFQSCNVTNANDTLSSAFNVKINKFFYWKVNLLKQIEIKIYVKKFGIYIRRNLD